MPAAYAFTVFTPTYNRAHTLHRVYESLQAQTMRDFEWLIVDDGSTDQTRALVEGWQQQAEFPIRYLYQANQGKHVAFNAGVAVAQGELFFCLDSDDACLPETLATCWQHWRALPAEKRAHFVGVTVLSQDQHGKLWGNRFAADVQDSDTVEMYYRYRARGDKKHLYRTDVLCQFPFPVQDGMPFVPETLIWRAIGRSFKSRYINEALYIRYASEGAVSDQLSRTVSLARYAPGGRLLAQANLNYELGWFDSAPAEFVRSAINYVRFSLHTGVGVPEQLRQLKPVAARLLVLVLLPVGLLMYLRNVRRHTG